MCCGPVTFDVRRHEANTARCAFLYPGHLCAGRFCCRSQTRVVRNGNVLQLRFRWLLVLCGTLFFVGHRFIARQVSERHLARRPRCFFRCACSYCEPVAWSARCLGSSNTVDVVLAFGGSFSVTRGKQYSNLLPNHEDTQFIHQHRCCVMKPRSGRYVRCEI